MVGGRGFWSQQQVEDLRALLAVVANPLDDEPLFGALASPACAVLPDTLWLLRRAATTPAESEDEHERTGHVWPVLRDLAEHGELREGGGDPEAAALIPAEERERLRAFAETLTTIRRRGAEGGLEALVERVATAFGYDLATLVRDHGAERWANVRKLMRLAREFEAREGPDLAAFLDYLDSRAASRDREAEAATRAEGHAGVRRDDRPRREGARVRRRRSRRPRARPPASAGSPLRVEARTEEPDAGEVGAGRRAARAPRAARRAPARLRGADRARRRPRGRGGGPARLRRRDPREAPAAC